MKKKTPKRKPAIKPAELRDDQFLFDEVDFVALKFSGRFALAWFFIRKAFDSLIKGEATV